MAKIKFDNYDFNFNPNMDFETFIQQNIRYYMGKYLQENPTMAVAINDWELDWLSKYIEDNKESIFGDMAYLLHLQENYSNTEDSLKEKKQKRWDTRIWTIEKKYWIDLWVRSDMKLSNYLDREGFGSLSKIIENR